MLFRVTILQTGRSIFVASDQVTRQAAREHLHGLRNIKPVVQKAE
jgi:hypothetical protein